MTAIITKTVLKMIADDIELALQEVAKKHGVQIKRGNGTFDSGSASLKININTISANGEVQTPESVDLKRHYPHLVGKKIAIEHRTFTIVGYKPKNWKKPFIIRENKMGGKTFKCSDSTVDQAIMRAK